MPGPPKKPTALKLLHGTLRKDRENRREPKPSPPRSLRAPAWLSAEAKREWKRVAPELRRLGLFTVLDHTSLAAYCSAYARAIEASHLVEKHGMTLKTKRGVVKNPAVTIERQAFAQVRAFCADFGLSPSSRARVSGMQLPADDDDAAAFLFNTVPKP